MHYFVGIGIYHSFTGVEKAMFNRLKLFKQHQIPAKLLTVNYHHLSSMYAKQFGIENDVLNMYDYFQQCMYVHPNQSFDYTNYWRTHLGYDTQIVNYGKDIKVTQNGRKVIYARFFDDDFTQPMFINYFNARDQFVKHEEYDVRGFLSSVCHYAEGNKTVYQEFFTPTGEKVIEKYYDEMEKNLRPTMIFLKNHYGQFEKFDSEEALISHFLDLIHKPDDIFVIDRPLELVPAFLNMQAKANKAVVIHMQHLADNRLKWPYDLLFKHLDQFNALITSTKAQQQDIASFIQHDAQYKPIHVTNIPVGYVDQQLLKIPNVKKQRNHFISVSRYVVDKQLDHQIRVIHRLHEKFPDITLDLYGFGSQHQQLDALIQSLNAESYIKLRGFKDDLTNVYGRAVASLLTSNSEGFALAVLESLSHHTPVIAYDIDYGPNEMIIDGVNGNLVPLNDEEALYNTLYQLLSNQAQQIHYFNQCIPSIEPYYDQRIIEQWQTLFKQIQTKSDQK
ncbi:glycosyltransferase [Macrococcus capreoli]|uniref:glycosyltransferase n=1 Tax=Macrococcus capreoli TaxID=2982690 RepID=UPI003EE443AE